MGGANAADGAKAPEVITPVTGEIKSGGIIIGTQHTTNGPRKKKSK